MTRFESYLCPKCKHKNKIKIYDVLENDKIKKIIDKSIFSHECKKCHERVVVEYPLNVKGKNYFIFYTPSKNADIDKCEMKINRVCDTFADLKEKILILEDGLDDIIIEVVKEEIRNNLSSLGLDNLDDLERIRYNSKDSIYLNFSLTGMQKLVGYKIEDYLRILKKIKVKKIKKSVLIDEYTYKNYIKRGNYEVRNKKRVGFFKRKDNFRGN